MKRKAHTCKYSTTMYTKRWTIKRVLQTSISIIRFSARLIGWKTYRCASVTTKARLCPCLLWLYLTTRWEKRTRRSPMGVPSHTRHTVSVPNSSKTRMRETFAKGQNKHSGRSSGIHGWDPQDWNVQKCQTIGDKGLHKVGKSGAVQVVF